jgi:hypothetical protein
VNWTASCEQLELLHTRVRSECFESHLPYRHTAELYFVPDRLGARLQRGRDGRDTSAERRATPDKAATGAEVMTKTRRIPAIVHRASSVSAIAITFTFTFPFPFPFTFPLHMPS